MIEDLTGIQRITEYEERFIQAMSKKEVIVLTKVEVNNSPFNSLNWRIHKKLLDLKDFPAPSGYCKSKIWYDNPFDKLESNCLEFFPQLPESISETFHTYLGKRMFKTKRRSDSEIQRKINEINKKWDCTDSKKIQEWYMENNSEYQAEIANAKWNEKVYCVEVILSDLGQDDIKKILTEHYKQIDVNPGHLIQYLESKIVTEKKSIGRSYDRDFYDKDSEFGLEESYYNEFENSRCNQEEEETINVSYMRNDYMPEPSDEDIFKYIENSDVDTEYNRKKEIFKNENFEDYDDYLYMQRIRDDEE